MKNNSNQKIFRSEEFWNSSIMTMPDNSFFELMRSVFGKIKTPFNKQKLINDLKAFLLKEEIQQTITSYIDSNDARIISAIALFGEPAQGDLESFFAGELSCAELQDIIVNLEERFICYRFTEENTPRIALNPVLERILLPFAENTKMLFPAVKEKDNGNSQQLPEGVLNDRILAGLFSFVSQYDHFLKTENVIRKRVLDAGKTCFPKLDLNFIFGSLRILGLFYAEGNLRSSGSVRVASADKLIPDKKLFDSFASLSARERSEYCAAAMLVYSETETDTREQIISPIYRGRIREYVNFIHSFLDVLENGFLYPEKTLLKIIEILKTKTRVHINSILLDILEKNCLIVKQGNNYLISSFEHEHQKTKNPVIAIDSGHSVLIYPEIEFSDAIILAQFMDIIEAGAVVRFEITKDSAVRAYDANISAQEIIELLNKLSCGRIDETLEWNLNDWEKRHKQVALKKGIVLTLSEDYRYLIETKNLKKYIIETLADGVYLLPENSMDDAADVLHSAGIDIISRSIKTKNINERFSVYSSYHNQFPNPAGFPLNGFFSRENKNADDIEYGKSENIINNFNNYLKGLKLEESAKTELSARIERKLILCESQLKDADVRYEKLEARNMDYTGKQNIAKQAIALKSPVEIVWQGNKRIFGMPKALEKEKNELVLVIEPAGNEEKLRIPLAKIGLLRRIKKSLFA